VFGHDWEAVFAPYDEGTQRAVLAHITPHDMVLDIGAGDLRLTKRVAAIARRVYAIERDPAVLARSDRGEAPWPGNLIVICADALATPFPDDVTAAILMMRHCTREHFAAYVQRLRRCALPAVDYQRALEDGRRSDRSPIDAKRGVRSRSGRLVCLPLRFDRLHAG
jgi:SAM-dependent methyltransferase